MIGRDERHTIRDSETLSIIWSFEYARGGSLDMGVTLRDSSAARKHNHSLQVMLFTESQLEPLRGVTMGDICHHDDRRFDYTQSVWQTQLGRGHRASDRVIIDPVPAHDWYYVVQLNCHEDRYYIALDYVAVNPGGEYLSLSDVPYKTTYKYLTVFWVLLAVGWWYASVWRFRWFNVRLQAMAGVVPLMQGILAAVLLSWWYKQSITGHRPRPFEVGVAITDGVARITGYVFMMYFAHGYMLIHARLPSRYHSRIWTSAATLFISFVLFRLVSGFFFFLTAVLCAFALRMGFRALTQVKTLLAQQCMIIETAQCNLTGTPLFTKVLIFKRLQQATVTYLCAYVLMSVWGQVFLSHDPWLRDLILDAMVAATCLAIADVLLPRPFNPFYHLLESRMPDRLRPGADAAAADDAAEEEPRHRDRRAERRQRRRAVSQAQQRQRNLLWHPGDPRPKVTDVWSDQQADSSQLVLVYQPAISGVRDVAVARPVALGALQFAPMPSSPVPSVPSSPRASYAQLEQETDDEGGLGTGATARRHAPGEGVLGRVVGTLRSAFGGRDNTATPADDDSSDDMELERVRMLDTHSSELSDDEV